jgi:hypothetical protein
MFEPRISAAAAGTAFAFSLLLGLVNGVRFPWLLLRPLIFAVLFFLLSTAIYQVLLRVLPELLEGDGETSDYGDESLGALGSRINIMEGEGSDPVPAMVSDEGENEDEGALGNISDFIGGASNSPAREQPAMGEGNNYAPPLDHPMENRYTGGRAEGRVSPGNGASAPAPASGAAAAPRPASSAARELGGVDMLPDLDSLAGAFLTPGEGGEEGTDYSSAGGAKKPSPGGKGQSMAGDFNPKELAAAIRTKLKREEG